MIDYGLDKMLILWQYKTVLEWYTWVAQFRIQQRSLFRMVVRTSATVTCISRISKLSNPCNIYTNSWKEHALATKTNLKVRAFFNYVQSQSQALVTLGPAVLSVRSKTLSSVEFSSNFRLHAHQQIITYHNILRASNFKSHWKKKVWPHRFLKITCGD